MNRNTQSGAIGTFVIVGVVLVATALAVLYGVRQFTISQRVSPVPTDIELPSRGESTADNNQQSQQNEKRQEDKKSDASENIQSDQKDGDAEDKKANTGSDSKSETGKRAETAVPSGSTSEAATPVDNSLPQTGPIDSMAAIVLLGGMTGITTAYVRSRRLV